MDKKIDKILYFPQVIDRFFTKPALVDKFYAHNDGVVDKYRKTIAHLAII